MPVCVAAQGCAAGHVTQHLRARPPTPQTIARRVPSAAYFTTTAIRFVNNVIGGENFIDMARWAGVQ